MQKNLLENIIRRFLTEAEIKVSQPQVPSTADEIKYHNQVLTLVNPNAKSEANNVQNLGVLQYEIVRKGFPGEDKEFVLSTSQLHQYIINQLNQTRGYADKTGLDFSWFLFTDQKKILGNKSKDEKRRAKYVIMAVYVKSNLLTRDPLSGKTNSSQSGWITNLQKGAPVFSFSNANSNWWKSKELDVATEEVPSNIPLVTLQYSDNRIEVKKLIRFFRKNFSSTMKVPTDTKDYDCSIRALVSQFQEENGIKVTGIWDESTWKKANELKYEETDNKQYIVKDPAALLVKWNACEIEKQSKEQEVKTEINTINWPATGQFVKGDANPEISKIQVLMVECLVITGLKDGGTPEVRATVNKFINAINEKNASGEYPKRGTFGPLTEDCVKLLSNQYINFMVANPTSTVFKSLSAGNNIINKPFVENLYTTIKNKKG